MIFRILSLPHRTVIFQTDDWVEFERFQLELNNKNQVGRYSAGYTTEGTHPSHEWSRSKSSSVTTRCSRCGAWDNGSYGSHAPCGYDFGQLPLVTIIEHAETRAQVLTAEQLAVST